MTYQIKLTDEGDIDLTTGQIQWVDGNDAILQHIKSRLSFAVGNFSIYPQSGTPYFQYILGSKNKALASSIIKRRILDTPGVKSIDIFDYSFNGNTRTLTITFSLTTIYGKVDNTTLDLGI